MTLLLILAEMAILLEINRAIGLRLQHYPTVGKPRNVAKARRNVFAKDGL